MTLERDYLLKNRYQILDVLGKGGMGAVYRALDLHLNIEVAVKENLFLSNEYTRQFQREANILAGMRHSNLPKVSDYFLIDGQGQYMVMDFVQGEDLRQRMERSGPLPEDEVTLIGIAVCDALSYLHTRKPPIIHRDLKPGNIKINPEGQIVLVDFGLAKVMAGQQVTITGARAMTPGYSPPEQYGTARTDARSDIYSLAATLYASLTGIIPEDSLARATGNAVLTPIRQLDPRINRKLTLAIEKALELDPSARFQIAEEFKSALLDSIIQTRTIGREIVVSPPPADQAAIVPLDPLDGDGPVSDFTYPYARKSSPLQPWRSGSSWLALAILAIVLWGGVNLLLRPPLSARNILAAFLPPEASPTSTITRSEPTQTQAGILPAFTPTVSATIEPTHTLSPTRTNTAQPTPFGGGAGEIAFVSTRTGSPQIWLMDAFGGHLTQVTNLPDGACQPDWSPDGTRLVFISPCQGRRELYLRTSLFTINADGTDILALPASPEGDFDPAWSPDGSRIAFTSLRSGQPKIYVLNLNDQSLATISNSPYSDRNPAWSPSGTQLAFVRARTAAQIWVSTDTGQSEAQFSRSGDTNNDIWPVWSPDGQLIYFTQTTKEKGVPWLMLQRYENRGTSQAVRIPEVGAPQLGPVVDLSVSSDGFWLVYEGWPEGDDHDIYRMSITGASIQRLTTDPAVDFQPDWRPTR